MMLYGWFDTIFNLSHKFWLHMEYNNMSCNPILTHSFLPRITCLLLCIMDRYACIFVKEMKWVNEITLILWRDVRLSHTSCWYLICLGASEYCHFPLINIIEAFILYMMDKICYSHIVVYLVEIIRFGNGKILKYQIDPNEVFQMTYNFKI